MGAVESAGVSLVRAEPGATIEETLRTWSEGSHSPFAVARICGVARGVVLTVPVQGEERQVFAEGSSVQIVQADAVLGPDGFVCHAIVSASCGGVPVLVGGRLIAGEAVALTLVVQPAAGEGESVAATRTPPAPVAASPLSASQPSRHASAGSGPRDEPDARPAPRASSDDVRSTPAASSPGGVRPSSSPTAGGWSRVAAVSAQVAGLDADDQEVDADDLERGDVLLHPKLGRCLMLGLSGSDAVRIRVPSGSARKLTLRPFRVYRTGNGREFELRMRSSED